MRCPIVASSGGGSAWPAVIATQSAYAAPRPVERGSRWVYAGLLALAGLAWLCHRREGGRRARQGGAVSVDQLRAALQIVEKLKRSRDQRRSLSVAGMLCILPSLLEIHSAWSARFPQRALPAHLSKLAALLAPLGSSTVDRIRQEVDCGGIDSMRAVRDEAVRRLRTFCRANGVACPEGVLRVVAGARILPHDSEFLPPVCIRALDVGWSRHWVLAYRPDCLAPEIEDGMALQPDMIGAFRGIVPGLQPCDGRPAVASPPPTRLRGRAVLRAMLHSALQSGMAHRWRRPNGWGADSLSLVSSLTGVLHPLWGEKPGDTAVLDALVGASCRLLADLVWGEHVAQPCVDPLGVSWIVLLAVAGLPQQRQALHAWFSGDAASLDALGRAIVEEAQRLVESNHGAETS